MGRLTPPDIREHEFKQSALGYNRNQVNELLAEIADELEALTRESNKINLENKEVRLVLKTYMNVEDKLKETLELAQKAGQETLRNAHKEADTILLKANTEKNALLHSAKEDLSIVQHDIRKLRAKRDSMLVKLKSILRSNLELLEEEFSDDALLLPPAKQPNERIVDFSKTDLIVDDLSEMAETPKINFKDDAGFKDE